jgi:hypothetical protein
MAVLLRYALRDFAILSGRMSGEVLMKGDRILEPRAQFGFRPVNDHTPLASNKQMNSPVSSSCSVVERSPTFGARVESNF